ncbi:MAG: ABC transporter substrate-binding protein [Bradyrhizobiaceae bacterium]|nr:MAG: ABC transporter substrate-binding protein [Bradyrhizobiaceae bacterium]
MTVWPIKVICASAIAALALSSGTAPSHAQDKSEISITRQPGIVYLPTHVMEKQQLIEKEAEKLGLKGLKVNWVNLSGGSAQTDALLAGSVDLVNTGVGNLLLLNDRTKGGVKGIVATSALPLALISRDPRIKTLADIKPGDKIAVPTVKVSTQAILLQMASAKMYGDDQYAKLDANTVQLGHPDAFAAMSNVNGEITSHFAAPPFQFRELKNVPGAHIVVQSQDIIGGPLTQSHFFCTTKFADANPKIIQAVKAATLVAQAFIREHTPEAVRIYKEVTNDPTSDQDLLQYLKEPDMMEFNPQPQGVMKFAQHLYKIGTLKTEPKSWKDYYLSTAEDLPGN